MPTMGTIQKKHGYWLLTTGETTGINPNPT
jgi:hypothetical protein